MRKIISHFCFNWLRWIDRPNNPSKLWRLNCPSINPFLRWKTYNLFDWWESRFLRMNTLESFNKKKNCIVKWMKYSYTIIQKYLDIYLGIHFNFNAEYVIEWLRWFIFHDWKIYHVSSCLRNCIFLNCSI